MDRDTTLDEVEMRMAAESYRPGCRGCIEETTDARPFSQHVTRRYDCGYVVRVPIAVDFLAPERVSLLTEPGAAHIRATADHWHAQHCRHPA